MKINHIKDGEWSKDFPNVKFDDITYDRKARKGTNNIYGYNITDSHKPAKPYVFRWDKGDTKTETWWPQGVSGNGNSDLGGNKRLIMNSWYSKGKHGFDSGIGRGFGVASWQNSFINWLKFKKIRSNWMSLL